MTELVMLEASLFRLQTATPPELELAVSVLANAVASARDGANAARARDIEFALNDVAEAADNLSQSDADVVLPLIDALRADVAALKDATALAADVAEAIGALRAKLAQRKSTIERQGSSDGLAPPEDLARDAGALRAKLAEAGFATPALDAFLAQPEELLFYAIVEIIDELETVSPRA
ncbi:MAG TPA: hypothetical protein VG323_05615 [Thermoanaerobaculia bacterium]|nr:hypothetical protein [Thermoanaerobaculia bacterium]